VPHPMTKWKDCQIGVDEDGKDCAGHASGTEDVNCVVGLEPQLFQGRHQVVLKFVRPPDETEAAHSVELVSAGGFYDDTCPSLAFELPNVQNCVAEFVIDFDHDLMTMRPNDGTQVSLPISDLEKVGQKPPYRLVHYMWDAGSTCTILS